VTLAQDEGRQKLTIQDDGVGFEVSNKGRGGMGILIMRYRAKVIGAALDVQSRPNHGTQIACVFNPSLQEQSRRTVNG
jgi:signal transduction histidine kinase